MRLDRSAEYNRKISSRNGLIIQRRWICLLTGIYNEAFSGMKIILQENRINLLTGQQISMFMYSGEW
jgi:hypothetical protein